MYVERLEEVSEWRGGAQGRASCVCETVCRYQGPDHTQPPRAHSGGDLNNGRVGGLSRDRPGGRRDRVRLARQRKRNE